MPTKCQESIPPLSLPPLVRHLIVVGIAAALIFGSLWWGERDKPDASPGIGPAGVSALRERVDDLEGRLAALYENDEKQAKRLDEAFECIYTLQGQTPQTPLLPSTFDTDPVAAVIKTLDDVARLKAAIAPTPQTSPPAKESVAGYDNELRRWAVYEIRRLDGRIDALCKAMQLKVNAPGVQKSRYETPPGLGSVMSVRQSPLPGGTPGAPDGGRIAGPAEAARMSFPANTPR